MKNCLNLFTFLITFISNPSQGLLDTQYCTLVQNTSNAALFRYNYYEDRVEEEWSTNPISCTDLALGKTQGPEEGIVKWGIRKLGMGRVAVVA